MLVEGRLAHRGFRDREGRDREIAEIVVAGPRGMVNVLSGKPPEGSDPAEPPKAEAAGPDEGSADGGGDTESGETQSAVASSGAE